MRECSLHTMCHVSGVMCHVTHIPHGIFFFFLYPEKKRKQSDGASWWRVYYNGAYPVFLKKYFCTIFSIHLGFSQLTIETCYPNLLIQNHDYLKVRNEKISIL